MLSTLATLFSMLNSAWTFFSNLFGGGKKADQTEDAASDAVKMSNAAGRASADVARAAASKTQQELDHADQDAALASGRVRDADSLRDAQSAVADAITRSNQDPRTDR